MPPDVTTAPVAAPAAAPASAPATPAATAPAASPAPASAPAAAPTASAPAAAPTAAPAPADSLFSKPADAPAADPGKPGDAKPTEARPDWLPEKYAVIGADGKLDLQASSQKLAEGYAAAAKRIGTGDLPPESPDAYKDSPVPEAFKDVPLDPELTRSFRERAHKAGLTQSQLDFVMGEYFSVVPSVLNAAASLSADEARAELSKVWSSPSELQRNMTAAERAVSLMPGELQEQIRTKYGTDPVFWQFAAQFGRETREDRPASTGGSTPPATDVEAVMRSEAYRNPKHPDHQRVSLQVQEAFNKRFGTAPVVT